MRAIVVTDKAAGTAGMTLLERPEPPAAINDVVVQIHASGFVPTEMEWPSTWTDRRDRDRTPSIPGHELAGVVTFLGYGTTGLSVGQRVLGLADWHRDGTLAEYAAMEARNLARCRVTSTSRSAPASQFGPDRLAGGGLFDHGRLPCGADRPHPRRGRRGRAVVTQLAREFGAYVIGTGRAADREAALDFGAHEFVDLDDEDLEDIGGVDLVFDVIGGDIQRRSASIIRPGGTLVSVVGRPRRGRPTASRSTSSSSPIEPSCVRSSTGCGTDACGPTSATSRPSTTPSPRSTRPHDAMARRSFAFVHRGRRGRG